LLSPCSRTTRDPRPCPCTTARVQVRGSSTSRPAEACEPDVAQRAGDLRDHVVGSVLVAGDDDTADAVIGDRSLPVIGLRDHGVHPLECALGQARRPTNPRRGGEDENLRSHDAAPHARPLVARTEVALHTRWDRQVREPEDFGLHVVRVTDRPRRRVRPRARWGRNPRATAASHRRHPRGVPRGTRQRRRGRCAGATTRARVGPGPST
jgi:hypothetical protein